LEFGVAYVWWAFLLDWVARMVLLQRRCRSVHWERKGPEITALGVAPVPGNG
jgi:Na+-driven multidrug efflux pump